MSDSFTPLTIRQKTSHQTGLGRWLSPAVDLARQTSNHRHGRAYGDPACFARAAIVHPVNDLANGMRALLEPSGGGHDHRSGPIDRHATASFPRRRYGSVDKRLRRDGRHGPEPPAADEFRAQKES